MLSTESLNLQIASLKAMISDLSLRAKQAEQTAGHLMRQAHHEKWTDAQVQAFAGIVAKHIDARAQERSVQQQAVLQTTSIALNAALKETDDRKKARMLVNILRELSTSVQHLEKIGSILKDNSEKS
jgi:hypothetical protein